MPNDDIVIASACRTPIGSFGGALATLTGPALGSIAIREAVSRAGLTPDQIDEVIMGEVLTAGVGQAPARQAALGADLPESVPCLTLNKVCGSGLKAIMLAAQSVAAGVSDIVVAGGMESMSNAPYLLDKARTGYRLGHGEITDSIVKDGLWDVYNDFHMGEAAEKCADKYKLTREIQDAFATASYEKAIAAQKSGAFADEITPVTIKTRKGETIVSEDEELGRVIFDKIPNLRPVFMKGGTITAANASSLNDGAAACVIMTATRATELGITPLATISGQSAAAKSPVWFTTAPVDAVNNMTKQTGIALADIDLFEVNEAFSVVNLALLKELDVAPEKMNIHGGAVALGHPIGASGARILTTLLYALKQRDLKRGLATLCIGGGEAIALMVER